MKLQSIIGILALAAAFGAQAQYKYIGPDGKVTYSDQPPPPSAKVLEKKPLAAQSTGGADLPFALKTAMGNAPVTFYSAGNCGAPCSDARNYLNQRGIPFTEKTINTGADAAKFKTDIGTDQLPVMTVGSTKQIQWQQDAWAGALTAAGYPADNQLPKGYKNPSAVALVPPASSAPAGPTASNQGTANPSAPGAPAAQPGGGNQPSWFKGF